MDHIQTRLPMTRLNFASDPLLTPLARLTFSSLEPDDPFLRELSREQFQEMLTLANSNHVVMRSMETLRKMMAANRMDDERCEWATEALEHERGRITLAVSFLDQIRQALAMEGCDVTVIKSLDHWPDLGSDLDLYTNADPSSVIRAFTTRFHAELFERSWGDRLAHKWNFVVPGLPELIEVHIGRLGQTGELVRFGKSLPGRARTVKIEGRLFNVPAAEDRLIICTLQRMYRHFYIRLCDIADTVQLLETDGVDFEELHARAEESGTWEGVATFLVIVSDCAEHWRGRGIELPAVVRSATRFGADQITFARGFLRVPILPHSVRLYASEWTTLMSQGQLRNTARLSLLPWLATAAALGYKLTGSDKGIW